MEGIESIMYPPHTTSAKTILFANPQIYAPIRHRAGQGCIQGRQGASERKILFASLSPLK